MEDQMRRLQEDIIIGKYALNFSNMNSCLQEEMKFKMELCEQQMEEVRGRREVDITYIKIIKSSKISMISGGDHIY